MRRLVPVAAMVLVLAAATSALAFTEQQRDAPWALLGVSANGRSLVVGYESGGCLIDDGHPVVSESKRGMVVTVRQSARVPGAGEACPADLRLPRVSVSLRAPLNGRRVQGGPRSEALYVRTPGVVPRVIGMDRRDAIAALRAQGFRVKTLGRVRRGEVVRQRPRPGAVTPAGVSLPLVRLRVK
jgi:hypothetical protein